MVEAWHRYWQRRSGGAPARGPAEPVGPEPELGGGEAFVAEMAGLPPGVAVRAPHDALRRPRG